MTILPTASHLVMGYACRLSAGAAARGRARRGPRRRSAAPMPSSRAGASPAASATARARSRPVSGARLLQVHPSPCKHFHCSSVFPMLHRLRTMHNTAEIAVLESLAPKILCHIHGRCSLAGKLGGSKSANRVSAKICGPLLVQASTRRPWRCPAAGRWELRRWATGWMCCASWPCCPLLCLIWMRCARTAALATACSGRAASAARRRPLWARGPSGSLRGRPRMRVWAACLSWRCLTCLRTRSSPRTVSAHDAAEDGLRMPAVPWMGRIVPAPLGQWTSMPTHACTVLAGPVDALRTGMRVVSALCCVL